jgi:hypothetical protein
MERKWSIRTYKEGDENRIFDLQKAVYPLENYDLKSWLMWWRWKFKNNPSGSSIICIADNDGIIVGLYAAIPVALKIGTETIFIYQSLDNWTHPEYRRQGIFTALANKMFDEIEKNGTGIIFGFPNETTLKPDVDKLNYFIVTQMPLLVDPLNWRNSLRLLISNRFLLEISKRIGELLQKLFYRVQISPNIEGLTITRVNCFDDRINILWNKVSDQHKIAVVRDKDYLNWRYSSPDIIYSRYIAERDGAILGYIVVRCKQERNVKTGLILDFLAESEEPLMCLIAKAVEQCKQEKVDLIYTYVKANKLYHRALRRKGFIRVPFMRPSTLVARIGLISNYRKERLKEQQNWFVEIGDSDAV